MKTGHIEIIMKEERINIYLRDILEDLLSRNEKSVELNLKFLHASGMNFVAKGQPALYVYQDGCSTSPILTQLYELINVGTYNRFRNTTPKCNYFVTLNLLLDFQM